MTKNLNLENETTETNGLKTDKKTDISEVERIKNENAELLNLLQRTRADFENFRKRTEEQKQFAEKLSAEKTVKNLLPLLDTLSIAIKSNDSLLPVAKILEKSLSDLKLKMIMPEENTPFDPNLHEALSMEGGEGENEVVAEILRPGYIYQDNVIRAALVKVKMI